MVEHQVRSGGAHVFAVAVGDADATPVVLLHAGVADPRLPTRPRPGSPP